MIDHVNRNKLDNRRENLRVVTNQQNQMNRAKKAKGVSFDSTHGKYKAYFDIITIGEPKRRVNIGTFLSEQDALLAVANYKESIK